MVRKAKKLAAFLTALLMCACACACTQPGDPGRQGQSSYIKTDQTSEQSVRQSPDIASGDYSSLTVRKNNLEVCYDETLSESGPEFTVPVITGLKDKEIEAGINAKIAAAAKNMTTPDYFRGMKAPTGEDLSGTDPNLISLYGSVTYNCGNIISVNLVCTAEYMLSEEDAVPVYITKAESLNIDLNTGRDIELKDVFKDPELAKAYINGYIASLIKDYRERDYGETEGSPLYDEIVDWDAYLSGGEFSGISGNEKFSLSDSSWYATIHMDYPEIGTDAPVDPGFDLYIPIAGFIDPDKYVLSEESIFEDDSVSYCLMLRDLRAASGGEGLSGEYEDINGYWWINRGSYEYLDPALDAELEISDEERVELNNILRREYQRSQSIYGPDQLSCNMSISSWASQYGKYTNITKGEFASIMLTRDWSYTFYLSEESIKCFKPGSTEPMKLPEIFVYENWRDVMVSAFAKSAGRNGAYDFEPDGWNFRGLAYQLCDCIEGFMLYGDHLFLQYNEEADEMLRATYTEYEDISIDSTYCFTYVEYADLGCENLNIF